jgi:hypothetical protein
MNDIGIHEIARDGGEGLRQNRENETLFDDLE